MSYTINDIDNAVESSFEDEDWEGLSESLYSYRSTDDLTFHLDDIGTVRLLESFGGEGQGDDYYLIISVTDADGGVRIFKRNGWYSSYDGGYYEGPTTEVRAVEKLVTVYEEVK